MSGKFRKKTAVVLLIFSYCMGALLSPIYADNSEELSGFDALLSERNETYENTDYQDDGSKKVSIDDFTDVRKEDWFYPYLEYLVDKGTINGKTETSFEPNSTFSYAECSAVIVRYLGLENEAKKRLKDIVSRDEAFSNVWYAGYFEVLSQLGLFTQYGLFETDEGLLISVDRAASNSPVTRYRFAESISKSFELDSELKAKNVYSEVGGSGREFIVGGGYNSEVLEAYKSLIADFREIPDDSAEYVLKAYYNGIFNGDVSGNFYPHNNLTRGEMAKVLATVSDYSLRTRLVNDGYGQKVSEDMLHTDAFGRKTLSHEVWTELLSREAEKLSISGEGISYQSSAYSPEGYAIDVYLYEKSGQQYIKSAETSLHEYNGGRIECEAEDAKVLFVIRNTAADAQPEGTFEVIIESGQAVYSGPCIRKA